MSVEAPVEGGRRRMAQLDALRTFAVAAVLVHHFIGPGGLPQGLGAIPWGHLGVRLFFVLSGFLITGVLIRSRDSAELLGQSRSSAVGQFYVRRLLRILPPYYLAIAITLIFDVRPVREILPWLLTFTPNMYITLHGDWIDRFSHFWALAVIVQFYVFWPWVILFVPRKRLMTVTCLVTLLGPLYRLFTILSGLKVESTYCFTFACLDTLGMGSLLALSAVSPRVKELLEKHLAGMALSIGVCGVVILFMLYHFTIGDSANIVFFDFSIGLVFCWLVHRAGQGFDGMTGTVLRWRPLTYCGMISYGVYVYHHFMPSMVAYVLEAFGWSVQGEALLELSLWSLATFCVAALSWHLIESPLSRLGRNIGNRRSPTGDVIATKDSMA